jgi:hypothetical protein
MNEVDPKRTNFKAKLREKMIADKNERLKQRVTNWLRKRDPTWARDVVIERAPKDCWTLSADNDAKLSDDLCTLVERNCSDARVLRTYEVEGKYDWASDAYFRPVSCVLFKYR